VLTQPTCWTVGAPTWPWLTATVRRYRGLIARTLVWAVVGGVDRDVPDVVRGVCERVGDVVGGKSSGIPWSAERGVMS
jgi:hypothetical protein